MHTLKELSLTCFSCNPLPVACVQFLQEGDFFFSPLLEACGSQFPNQGSNRCPLQWTQSPNRWTVREFPRRLTFINQTEQLRLYLSQLYLNRGNFASIMVFLCQSKPENVKRRVQHSAQEKFISLFFWFGSLSLFNKAFTNGYYR